MGKGNKRSKRGKIWRGTYGKYRRRKKGEKKRRKQEQPAEKR